MTISIAKRLSKIEASATLALNAKAKALQAAGRDIINLTVGEPDFHTPDCAKIAGKQAIDDNFTTYTPADGIPSLKQAICDKLQRDNSLSYEPSNIITSTGAKQCLFNAIAALINPGDEVIIPAPYWVSYRDLVLIAEGVPKIVVADIEQDYKMNADQLAANITDQTRMIILNSPTNPTGQVYSANELQALAEVLVQHPQIFIITDDIYEFFLYGDEPFHNIINVCPELKARSLIVNGVSKSYAMTGWRLGYAAGPKEVISAMKKLQSQATGNPCSITQRAALAAITSDQQSVRDMTKAFAERQAYLYEALSNIPGVNCIPARGAFYSFVKVDGLIAKLADINDDLGFADLLLEEYDLAVVPGTAFGLPGAIRLSFAASLDTLKAAVSKLKQLANKLHG